jgi:hypothetical protein
MRASTSTPSGSCALTCQRSSAWASIRRHDRQGRLRRLRRLLPQHRAPLRRNDEPQLTTSQHHARRGVSDFPTLLLARKIQHSGELRIERSQVLGDPVGRARAPTHPIQRIPGALSVDRDEPQETPTRPPVSRSSAITKCPQACRRLAGAVGSAGRACHSHRTRRGGVQEVIVEKKASFDTTTTNEPAGLKVVVSDRRGGRQ